MSQTLKREAPHEHPAVPADHEIFELIDKIQTGLGDAIFDYPEYRYVILDAVKKNWSFKEVFQELNGYLPDSFGPASRTRDIGVEQPPRKKVKVGEGDAVDRITEITQDHEHQEFPLKVEEQGTSLIDIKEFVPVSLPSWQPDILLETKEQNMPAEKIQDGFPASMVIQQPALPKATEPRTPPPTPLSRNSMIVTSEQEPNWKPKYGGQLFNLSKPHMAQSKEARVASVPDDLPSIAKALSHKGGIQAVVEAQIEFYLKLVNRQAGESESIAIDQKFGELEAKAITSIFFKKIFGNSNNFWEHVHRLVTWCNIQPRVFDVGSTSTQFFQLKTNRAFPPALRLFYKVFQVARYGYSEQLHYQELMKNQRMLQLFRGFMELYNLVDKRDPVLEALFANHDLKNSQGTDKRELLIDLFVVHLGKSKETQLRHMLRQGEANSRLVEKFGEGILMFLMSGGYKQMHGLSPDQVMAVIHALQAFTGFKMLCEKARKKLYDPIVKGTISPIEVRLQNPDRIKTVMGLLQ